MQQKKTGKPNLFSLRRQYTHPHELYNVFREQDSVYFDPTSQSWLVTGHKAIVSILDDPRFVSKLTSLTTTSSIHTNMILVNKQLLFMDGKEHQYAQSILLRSLSSISKEIPHHIRRYVKDAIVDVYEKGEMEAVNDFSAPIALLTIAKVLGIPTNNREELRQLEQWSDTFGDVTSGYLRGDIQDIRNLENYFHSMIAHKRNKPSNDLLSTFIEAKDAFPDEEALVSNCMMVFAAGRITTKKLLGNGITLLAQQWEQHQAAFAENSRFHKLLGEELLRTVTPTRYLVREACEDIDLSTIISGNHLIHRGQRVLLFLEAADYDPEVFAQPEQFNPHRHPNKHIAFGYGPHQCPGAALARIEIQVALEQILSLAKLRPKPGTSPVWNPNPNLGGLTSNPVIFEPILKNVGREEYN